MAGEKTQPVEATQEDADAAVLAAAKALEAAQVSLQEAEARRLARSACHAASEDSATSA